MKRGLIAWDKDEISAAVFTARLKKLREFLFRRGLDALVVYSELWRSNPARFFCNYMPYFNRALLILPLEEPPTLLCGLSPRVYSWIRSVTTIEDVRPAGNFVRPLLQLVAERHWTRIGCLDFEGFPYDLHFPMKSEALAMVSVDPDIVCVIAADSSELAIRRKAATMARQILTREMSGGAGKPDFDFVGQLERQFRRAGAEDLVMLVTNGDSVPAPATGAVLGEGFSISIAMEYRGHWIRMSRPHATDHVLRRCSRMLDHAIAGAQSSRAVFEDLGGSYPYECFDPARRQHGSIVAVHVECVHNGRRLFYGDTGLYDHSGFKAL